MSPRLPRITGQVVARALRRDGWYDDHQTGSHLFMRHPTRPGIVTVPVHAGRIIKPRTLGSILDQAGIDADDLRRLL